MTTTPSRVRKPHPPKKAEVETEEPGISPGSSASVADIDEILDEIDEILEHNAEVFVRNYTQKGGE